MKFNITLVKEEFDENGFLKDKDKKVVEVNAPTCCEAAVKATKANRGWIMVTWDCLEKDKLKKLDEFIPENEFEKKAWEKVLKEREAEKSKKETKNKKIDKVQDEE